MTDNYHFNKNFVLTPHTITDQLKALHDRITKRDEAEKQLWVDTVPQATEAEAQERMAVLKDRWHRPNGGRDA